MNQHLLCTNANIRAIIVIKSQKEVNSSMLHHKAFRFRIYPTEEQTKLIRQMLDALALSLTTSLRGGTTPSMKQVEACLTRPVQSGCQR
ncbi:helix-turn-helix domain-containing protein [Paenibacillus elgii]|uniref:helix-turn-helix domain-containing protein n=1 Tax=Paenibacillus elgii TaxID=189691 RepID=UPI0027BA5691|nr:helix-turn-helix domain-containing protein [Paenibacillus elgii]